MQSLLGNDYEVVVDALSGRTTDAPDPGVPMAGAALDGSAYLPSAIAAHFPLDLVVIMLGTNAIASFAEVPEILEVRALLGQRDNIVRFEDRDTGMG
jgi:lysophospholipase L1-like esterase